MRKASLAVCFIASATIVGQLRGVLAGSPLVTSLIFAIYPAIIVGTYSKSELMDIGYLASVFFSIGGVLVYGHQFPIGFEDVYRHTATMVQSYTGGSIQIVFVNPSQNFISYYVYITSIGNILGVNPITVAQYAPVVLFFLTVLIFYTVLARPLIDHEFNLVSTLIFALMYGVFRFNTEFRTLNLGLLLAVLLTGLFMSELYRRARWRIPLISFISITALVVAHFGSFFIACHLFLPLSLIIAWRKRRFAPLTIVVTGLIIIYLYMAYLGGSLTFFTSRGVVLLNDLLIGAGGGPAVEDGTRSPFEDAFLLEGIQWTIRIGFIISTLIAGIHWLLTGRDDYRFALFTGLGVLGLATLGSILGFSVGLNPGRYLTFVAIPYGLIYANGVQVSFDELKLNRWARFLTILVLVILLILSVLPVFPTAIIGPTEPLRDSDTGESEIHEVSQSDIATINFINERVAGEISYENVGNMDLYDHRVESQTTHDHSVDGRSVYSVTQIHGLDRNTIFTNGNTFVTHDSY